MGILRILGPPERHLALGARVLVGRAPYAIVALTPPQVSLEHAVVRYAEGWQLLDLGSRNGTFIEGRRISTSEPAPIQRGDRLSFGLDRAMVELIDDAPPGPAALEADGTLHVAEDGLLTFVDDEAEVSVHWQGTRWQLEQADDAVLVTDGQVLELGSRRLTLLLPPHPFGVSATLETDDGSKATLEFVTAQHGDELVRATLRHGPQPHDLTIRKPLLLLLILAQQRLHDEAQGKTEIEAGWVSVDALCRQVPVPRHLLGTYVHRARRQLASAGAPTPERIVESRGRRDARQLRLGSVVPLVR